MYPLIVFPDIEAWSLDWLYRQISVMADRPWASKVTFDNVIPRDGDRPEYLVVINRNGGATYDHFDHPRLRINVWAPNESDCEEICRVIGGLLLIARTDPHEPVTAAAVNGSFRVADETGGARRAFWANLITTGTQGA